MSTKGFRRKSWSAWTGQKIFKPSRLYLRASGPVKSYGVLSPFPPRMLTKLRLNATTSITITNGNQFAEALLVVNSAFDPLQGFGSAQASGYQQLKNVYDLNIVNRVKVVVSVTEFATVLTNPMIGIIQGPAQVSPAGTYDGTHLIQHKFNKGFNVYTSVNQRGTVYAAMSTIQSQPDTVGARGNVERPVSVMRYIDIPAQFGLNRDAYDPEFYGADFTADPDKKLYMHINIADELGIIVGIRQFTVDVQIFQFTEVYAPVTNLASP